MKRTWCVVAVAAMLVSGGVASALDEIGNPVPMLKQGEFGVGLESDYSQRDMTLNQRVFGIDLGDRGIEIRRTTVGARLDYGVIDGIEVFVRMGASWDEGKSALGIFERIDGEETGQFATGAGVKFNLYKIAEGIFLGGSVQVNYHRLDVSGREVVGFTEPEPEGGEGYSPNQLPVIATESFEANLFDVTTAVGVSAALDPFTVYGGIFASWTFATEDFDVVADGVNIPADAELQEHGNMGLFVGASVPVVKDFVSVGVNAHLMDGGWGAGGLVIVRL
jgi:hypothetical protein